MVIDFDGFISKEKFDKDVIPLIKSTGTQFSFYKEDFKALIILERQPLFFIFLTYVPTGHHTRYPTLEQSMQNQNGIPRQSRGEWVVDTVFQTRESDAKSIFIQIEKQNIKKDIIKYIHEQLYNF